MDEFIKVAKEAAAQAGEYLKKKIQSAKIVKHKSSIIDVVTDADIGAQKLIIDLIKKNFPSHNFLAEEQKGKIEISNRYTWTIDPIDGTSAYAARLPTYSSSIALLYKKKPIVGAIYQAITDDVVWAGQSLGAYRKEEKLSVSKVLNLKEATIGFDPNYNNRERDMSKIAGPLSDRVRILPMIWSQAAALSLVACGILDGFIQCGRPKVWDVAAGKIIVEEAGGRLTDFNNKQIDIFALDGYIAGSSSITEKLLQFT